MRLVLTKLSVLTIALLAAPTTDAAAPTELPPPGSFGLVEGETTYEGPGCPAGSARASVSTDGQTITVIYDSFVTALDPEVRKAKSHCQLKLKMRVPSGWQYAVTGVYHRGFVTVEGGVTAKKATRYQFQGEGQSAENGGQRTWTGPTEDDFNIQVMGESGPVYSKCNKGKHLKIRTDVEVSQDNHNGGAGYLALDTADAEIYQVHWRPCR